MKRLFKTFAEKWPEYLLEIFVITLGILGAYMLNNWNEGRKQNLATKDALTNVLEDLKQDSIQFGYHLKNSRYLEHNLSRTIHILLDSESDDSLEYYFNRSKGYLVAVVHNSAFQSMNQQGLLPNIKEEDLRFDLMRYFNFVQPNVEEYREFEYNRLQSSIYRINTNAAIDMDSTTFDDLQMNYAIVRKILMEPENLKRLYDYRDTQAYLKGRSRQYIDGNRDLIDRLTLYLNR